MVWRYPWESLLSFDSQSVVSLQYSTFIPVQIQIPDILLSQLDNAHKTEFKAIFHTTLWSSNWIILIRLCLTRL